MLDSFNGSYAFQSYSFINWLKTHDALINEQVTWTEHKYNLETSQAETITTLGKLNTDYKLTLTYY